MEVPAPEVATAEVAAVAAEVAATSTAVEATPPAVSTGHRRAAASAPTRVRGARAADHDEERE
jgi:hypothetical protein